MKLSQRTKLPRKISGGGGGGMPPDPPIEIIKLMLPPIHFRAVGRKIIVGRPKGVRGHVPPPNRSLAVYISSTL